MIDEINKRRSDYGKEPFRPSQIDNVECANCELHLFAMINEKRIYQSPESYRPGWAEDSVCVTFDSDWHCAEKRVVNALLHSEIGKDILLNSSKLAYSIQHWFGTIYATVRGKK